MKIVYLYPISSIEQFDYYCNYSKISENKEDHLLCVYRERYLEIEHFSKTGNCAFINDNFEITNIDFTPFENLDSVIMFPRMDILFYHKFLKSEVKNRIRSITGGKVSYEIISRWYMQIAIKYLRRKINRYNVEYAESHFTEIVNGLVDSENRFFMKSVEKHWSFAGSIKEAYETGSIFALSCGGGECLFSEFLEIKTDRLGKLEFRCYFINGKLCSISRYLDYEEHTIPVYIQDFAYNLQKEGFNMPKTIVIDIADTNKGIVIIECNEASCSGRYINNKLDTFPLETK